MNECVEETSDYFENQPFLREYVTGFVHIFQGQI